MRIDDNYIRKNYSNAEINLMREVISEKKVKKTFDLTILDFNPMSKEDFLKMLSEQIPDETQVEIISYGYDGGAEISCFKKVDRLETDKEIIDRIKSDLREKRKREREIEKAKKILGLGE